MFQSRVSLPLVITPLVVWLIFHSTTILLFVYGPFDWPVESPLDLGFFLGAVTIAIMSGYLLALMLSPASAKYLGLKNFAYSGAVLGLLLAVPAMYLYTGKTPADLGHAIANQGQVYQEMVVTAGQEAGARLYFATLRSLLAPLTFSVVPLFILYRRKIPFLWQCVGGLFLLAQLAFGVLRGTDKETVDLGIVIGVTIVAVALRARHQGAFSRTKLTASFLAAILLMGIVAEIFIWRKNQRLGEVSDGYCHHLTGRCADYDNVFVRWLPDQDRLGAILAINYLSQGYYGLSMALEEDFTFSYGLGHSNFVLDKATSLVGTQSIVQRTYIGKIHQRGWDRKRVWSTLYVWIANDVGFTGAVFVMFWVGFAFALSWKDFLSYGNAPALLFFLHLVITFFYASMNNQIMLSADQYLSFLVWLFLWIWSRRNTAQP